MRLFKRKEVTIRDEQTEVLNAVELWSVRWGARQSDWHHDVDPVAEFFTNEEDAQDFKKALEDAAKLLRYTEPKLNIRMRKEQ